MNRKKLPGCSTLKILPRLADPTRTIHLARACRLRDLAVELGIGESHEPTKQRLGGVFLHSDEESRLLTEWDRREPERRAVRLESAQCSRLRHAARRKRVVIVKRPYSDHIARAVESWRRMCLDPSEDRTPEAVWSYLLAASTVLRADEPMPADPPARLGRDALVALYGAARTVESEAESEAEMEARRKREWAQRQRKGGGR
jgi:hypothetical protein